MLRNLRFHAGINAAAAIGLSLAVTVVVGALVSGDSMHASLRKIAEARLGEIEWAVICGQSGCSVELGAELAEEMEIPSAAILKIPGAARTPSGDARVGGVEVVGIDAAFGAVFGATAAVQPKKGQVFLSPVLARELCVGPGDDLVLVLKPFGGVSSEVPLVPDIERIPSLRLTIVRLLAASEGAALNLRTEMQAPRNAFVNRAELAEAVGRDGRASHILLGTLGKKSWSKTALETALADHWRPADAGLLLRALPPSKLRDSVMQVESAQIFLRDVYARVLINQRPNLQIFTYLANTLAIGGRRTPYSLVAGLANDEGLHPLASDLLDDEVILNSWLADDLQARIGDRMSMSYFSWVEGELLEQTVSLTVHGVVRMAGLGADSALMPVFPGLSDVEQCSDWRPGVPMDLDRIRPRDEAYWEEFGGAPKAFVSLATAQRLWGSRFGRLTGVRLFDTSSGEVSSHLTKELSEIAGPRLVPLRALAEHGVERAMDFGLLVLGFGLFLVGAALTLVVLLLSLGLARRRAEFGVLLAAGFSPRRLRTLVMAEGAALAMVSIIPGAIGGLVFGWGMVATLASIWPGTVDLVFAASPLSVVGGAGLTALVGWITIAVAIRHNTRAGIGHLVAPIVPATAGGYRGLVSVVIFVMSAGALVGLTVCGVIPPDAGYFGAGAAALAALVTAGPALLRALSSRLAAYPGAAAIVLRNLSRRPGQTLSAFGLVAFAAFLIIVAGAHRQGAIMDPDDPACGTGGFSLIAETAAPLVRHPTSAEAQERYGISRGALSGVTIVPLRVRDGDDATCLNLNRVQSPRILGAPVAELDRRDAFTFTAVSRDGTDEDGWRLLDRKVQQGEIPAIADINTILWALGRQPGDVLEVEDSAGRTLRLRLVGALQNTILQGSVIISERNFLRVFPDVSGYRLFLVDNAAPGGEAAAALEDVLSNLGWEAQSTVQRLDAFNRVQNTYLSIFQLLAGLALLLGSLGLGLVLLRNALERICELAVMQVVGFSLRRIRRLILVEHLLVMGGGLLAGAAAASFAILPFVWINGNSFPFNAMVLTMASVLGSGILWTWFAARVALRGRLMDVLTVD